MVWKGLKLRPPAVKPLKTGAINKKAPTTFVVEAVCSGGGGDTPSELF